MKPKTLELQRGFTLLEVLVAFAISSIALVILMQIFSNGLRLSSRVEDYSRATVLAESLLAQIDREYAMEEAPFRGTFDDRFHWLMDVSPYLFDEEISDHPAVKPMKIRVQISWLDGIHERQFELDSLRLLPSQVH